MFSVYTTHLWKVLVVHGGHQDFSFFFPSWIYVTTPVMSPACVLIHQLKMLSFHCHVRWLEVRIVNRGFMGQSVGETMEWLELYQVPSLSLAPWIDVFVAVNVGHFVETQLPNPKRFWMIWISRWLDIFRRLCSCSLWVMNSPPGDGHLFFADHKQGRLVMLSKNGRGRLFFTGGHQNMKVPDQFFFHVFESISNIVPSNWMWHRCGPIICGSFSIIFLCKAGVPWIFFNIRGRCKKTVPDFGRVSWDPWDPGSPWILPWDFGKFHPKEVKHGTSTKILNTPTMSVFFWEVFFCRESGAVETSIDSRSLMPFHAPKVSKSMNSTHPKAILLTPHMDRGPNARGYVWKWVIYGNIMSYSKLAR